MSDPHAQYSQTPPQPGAMPPPPPAPAQGSNGLATAGFVLALIGLLGSWIPLLNFLAIILGLLGIVLAGVGLARAKKVNAGKGLAIAGIVLGVLAIVFSIVVNSAFVDAVDDATGNSVDSAPSGEDPGSSDGGEESSNEAGATRDNPVPIGSAITGGDWTVTVNSVEPVDSDSLGDTAQDGSILLLVNTTATYNGDDEQGSTPFSSIGYVTPDGNTIDSLDGSTLFIAENEFDSLTTVYSGAVVTGDQIIEVPEENWQAGVLAISPDLLSDDSFVAVR